MKIKKLLILAVLGILGCSTVQKVKPVSQRNPSSLEDKDWFALTPEQAKSQDLAVYLSLHHPCNITLSKKRASGVSSQTLLYLKDGLVTTPESRIEQCRKITADFIFNSSFFSNSCNGPVQKCSGDACVSNSSINSADVSVMTFRSNPWAGAIPEPKILDGFYCQASGDVDGVWDLSDVTSPIPVDILKDTDKKFSCISKISSKKCSHDDGVTSCSVQYTGQNAYGKEISSSLSADSEDSVLWVALSSFGVSLPHPFGSRIKLNDAMATIKQIPKCE